MNGPRILLVDIETAPILAHCWGIWQQDVGLNQIEKDWHLLSFSAKWLDSKEVMYFDQSKEKNIENDKKLLKKLWDLMDEADVIIGHNAKRFDIKKIQARFLLEGMKPTSSFKVIDTLNIAKKHFALTSNKLEYLSNKLCKKYKKLTKRKFSGFALWSACLKGNKEAWEEMRIYNERDVLALEEVYNILAPWDNSIDFNIYNDDESIVCRCGNEKFTRNGYAYTKVGRYQRYQCKSCGAESRGRKNLLSKEKRELIRVNTR